MEAKQGNPRFEEACDAAAGACKTLKQDRALFVHRSFSPRGLWNELGPLRCRKAIP